MKKIIIGEINKESFYGTPIEYFEMAVKLSKCDSFEISTNNPQFLEALEVLCGEENINVFLKLDGEYNSINFFTAYNYLGDIYDIINSIRFEKELWGDDGDIVDDEFLNKEIKGYKEEWYFK